MKLKVWSIVIIILGFALLGLSGSMGESGFMLMFASFGAVIIGFILGIVSLIKG